MKIAITGATGFIARHLIPVLSEKHDIIAVSRFTRPASEYPWLDGAKQIIMDITNPPKNAFSFMGNPDMLIHLAWGGLPNYKSTAHLREGAKHLLFLQSLLEEGLQSLTVTGTCFEYGLKNGPLSEDDITSPANPYGLAKDSLRKALEFMASEKKCAFKWIRLFYMYGEGQNPNSLLAQVDRAIQNGDSVFNMSGGEQLRDYLPVDQVAKNIALIAMQKDVFGVINCCSGEPISIRKLVENHIKAKAANISLNLGFYPYPDYEPMAFWGNNNKCNRIIQGNDI